MTARHELVAKFELPARPPLIVLPHKIKDYQLVKCTLGFAP